MDDDERVLFVLSTSLRRVHIPCDVITAQDGHAARRLLEASRFDLLITDIRLPGLDGVAITEFVRAQALHFPIIWMTAYGCRIVQRDATRLHVFRCLEKPVEVAEFRRIVRQALSAPAPVGMDGSAARATAT